jgi:ubiquinone/menaquinone biosynthesis C-methylase UbiE
MKTNSTKHKHTWIVVSVALTLALLTLIFLPKNKGYSLIFAGVAGGHLLILLLAIFAGWLALPQKLIDKLRKRKTAGGFDFGWSPKWLYSFLIASVLMFLMAQYLYFAINLSPTVRWVVYTLLVLASVNLLTGYMVLRKSKRSAELDLPMVTLLPGGQGKIVDAGCGAGRTTIAVARAMPEAKLIAFDRFDADYIEGGGDYLLKKNIDIAGISHRVEIEKGDIISTPFANNSVDAMVSSYMFDHLGANKQKALAESYRILKPGGRFLLIIAVRNAYTFALSNLLFLLFPTRATWKQWIEKAGFTMISDGKINEGAYFLFEKKK